MMVSKKTGGVMYLNGERFCEVRELFCDLPDTEPDHGRVSDPVRFQDEFAFTVTVEMTPEVRRFMEKQEWEHRKAVKKFCENVRKMAKSRSPQQKTGVSHPWPEKKSHSSWWKKR